MICLAARNMHCYRHYYKHFGVLTLATIWSIGISEYTYVGDAWNLFRTNLHEIFVQKRCSHMVIQVCGVHMFPF